MSTKENKSPLTAPLDELCNGFIPEISEPLEVLKDSGTYAIVIGRDASAHEEHGLNGTMFCGIVSEKNKENFGRKILLDCINPHKLFICGKTGSGKSYTLGVIAEELAEQGLGIGTIIVDPMGTFWSMKYTLQKKSKLLEKWGLSPKQYENIRIFIPEGLVDQYPEGTYDELFSINPNELAVEDWTNTFGIDYFKSPQSALITEIVKHLSDGGVWNYTIQNMLETIDIRLDLQDNYHVNSIRALKTRLIAAGSWGVFSTDSTPLNDISRPDQVSVIDVSLLPDNTRALIVGMLAKNILQHRTRIARREKVGALGQNPVDDDAKSIPVTWLMIDEAHTLAPSKGKTAASDPLIEYAKRGRMPGCSLVLATQQPSATNSEILSQIDILISHNLSYTQDIQELRRRTPSKFPKELDDESFIRNMPVGTAIIADQSTGTKRAFIARIRPRKSVHGGGTASPIKKKTTGPLVLHPQIKSEIEETPPIVQKPKTLVNESTARTNMVIKKIDIKIGKYDLPDEILQNYLRRFMEFRVVQEYRTFRTVDIQASIFPGHDTAGINIALIKLQRDGYLFDTIKVIDENQVVFFKGPNSMIATTYGQSTNSTMLLTMRLLNE